MKMLRRFMIVLLALVMIMPLTAHAAGKKSVGKNDIISAEISVKKTVYNGKKQKAKIEVSMGNTTLKEGKHYVVTGERKAKKAGTYTLTVKGIGKYSGETTVTYKIEKAKQSIKVNKVKKYKASSLKKKSQTFRLETKVKDKAKVTYSSSSKSVKVDKNGKVKLKKGLKKGTYKIYVKAKATKNYKAATKVIKIKVK